MIREYSNYNHYTESFYLQNLKNMSIEQRFRIFFDLNSFAYEICKASILKTYPTLSEDKLKKEIRRRLT